MPRVKPSLIMKLVICFCVGVLTSACSNTISQRLLSDAAGPQLQLPANSLAMPPAEALQTAVPNQNPAFVEQSDLPPDVPTLEDLSSRPLVGIDAPKVGLMLEQDVAAKKISETIIWRGKRSADGVDLANRNGALCSGSNNNTASRQNIKVACSDGRIGNLRLNGGTNVAQLTFRNSPAEAVEFVN